MDLLLIDDENKSHIPVSKTLRDLCSIRQKTKVKNTFTNIVYNFLVVKTSCNNIERYAYE